ncbi:MAG: anti-sigma regulatory factor [Candidatus Methanoperedens sp.]|nr:anti-sigma regulatory factor [Candidatus Methanoperedens sp.]
MADKACVPINSEIDIVTARQKGREMAQQLGFSSTELTLIATAISEVVRNIVEYAKHGELCVDIVQQGDKRGISVIAQDNGPGIPNIKLAMQDGYSTGKSLGLGLPGAKRLMDEFDIVSEVGKGTKVTMKKWVQKNVR